MPNVRMPPMPPKVRKVKLAKWLKAEGDDVQLGDVLAVIETNKAAIDVESEFAGTLTKILVAEGTEDLTADMPLATISEALDTAEPVFESNDLVHANSLAGAEAPSVTSREACGDGMADCDDLGKVCTTSAPLARCETVTA